MKFSTLSPSLPMLVAVLFSMTSMTACTTKYATPAKTTEVETEYDEYYGMPYRGELDVKRSSLIKPEPMMQKNAPTRYVVKKGDTLWGISQMFLKQPGYWPEIWDKNQYVKNPHRIYPGDVLYIHYGKQSVGNTIKITPTIRVKRTGKGNAISMFRPFLKWPRIVHKDDATSAPYIVAAKDASILIEKNRHIYAKGIPHSKFGDMYGVYHEVKEIHDPDTQELIGTQIDYHGLVSVTHPNEITTAIVEKSQREMRKGDRLIRVNDIPADLDIEMRLPRNKVRGTIMSLHDADIVTGQRMIAVVNRGHRDGIQPGHILGVYTPPRLSEDPYATRLTKFHSKTPISVKLPPERIGSMVVYDVNDRYSYALITKSDNAIKVGHKIGNP